MTRKQKRLAIIGGGVAFLTAAVLLVMFAFSQAVAYFYVPGDLAKAGVAPGTRIRLGGLVEAGSVKRGEGRTITFHGDGHACDRSGDLLRDPADLFREGQGVVAGGAFVGGSPVFVARHRPRKGMMRHTCRRMSPTASKRRASPLAGRKTSDDSSNSGTMTGPGASRPAISQGVLPVLGVRRGDPFLEGLAANAAARLLPAGGILLRRC